MPAPPASPASHDLVDYIRRHWDASVRCGVKAAGVVPVPLPHTVPSPFGRFNVLFYWDTYFTNLGLLRSGRVDLAQNNCDALLWWVDQRGFVPNSAFVGDDTRSQPPVLSLMVRDVHAATKNRAWLAAAVPRLEREHAFWLSRRTFPNGLAHYGHHADETYLVGFYERILRRRLRLGGALDPATKSGVAAHLLAEAESGQDFTPIYDHRALHHADVELNCLLFALEDNLSHFTRALGGDETAAQAWKGRAEQRAHLIRTILWDEAAGLFRPRDLVFDRFSAVAHLGTFWPLWMGVAEPAQAERVRAHLPRFERQHGLAQTEPGYNGLYQWAYPTGWPPSHWAVVSGLLRYGFAADARRIANKFCSTQQLLFAHTGQVWEKFDVTTGVPGGGEYTADAMLGWTAGVYLALHEVAEKIHQGAGSGEPENA